MSHNPALRLGDIELPLDVVIGASWAVLGITGSGKSNSIACLIEDLNQSVPFTVIDPDGEYFGLKDRYNFLIVGGKRTEISIDTKNTGRLAQLVYERGQSVILDVSEMAVDEAADFLHTYLEALWRAATDARRPHFVVLEEAAQFIPQGERSDLQKLLTQYAIRGRKRGIGLVIGNQRSSNISKDILTQARYGLYHNVAHAADLRILKDLIPWEAKRVETTVRGLTPGQAILVRGGEAQVVSMRLRHTFHGGATPGVDAQTPVLQAADAAFLADLREMLAREDSAPMNKDCADRQDDMIETLKQKLDVHEYELHRYKTVTDEIAALMKMDGRADMPMLDYVLWLRTRLEEALRTRDEMEIVFAAGAKVASPATSVPPQGPPPQSINLAALVVQRKEQADKRQQRLTQEAIRRQTARLDAEAKGLRSQRSEARIMLAYLFAHPGEWVDAQSVGTTFSYHERFHHKVSTAWLNSPFLRILMQRRGQEHLYRLAEDFNRNYPDLDSATVKARLLDACGV